MIPPGSLPRFAAALPFACSALLPALLWAATPNENPATALWYRQPAANWNEALPVGNGRLGAMIFGGVHRERLQLNEDSLWSGAPQDADNPAALEALPRIRELLFAGRYGEAERLANRTLICRGAGSGHGRGAKVPFGCYQTLGDLHLDFTHPPGEPTHYRRELDLATATARVSYEVDGVRFTREVFASHPDQALVVRLAASRKGALTFRAQLSRPEAATVAPAGRDQLLMRGQMWDGTNWTGMKFAARLRALTTGGTVAATTNGLEIADADAVTLLLTAATDYRMQLPDWRQGDPEVQTARQLQAAARKNFARLHAAHIRDYQPLFRRVQLDLGQTAAATAPTDERLQAIRAGASDPALTTLYFHFGRYLLISCSRPGTMPANLQGLWADGIQTPWNCDYHANINVQMNYWCAETANLPECFEPLDRYIRFLTGPGARTAKVHYGARGWTVHTIANPWGFTSPGEVPSWGLSPSAGAWLAQHVWEHYAFNLDLNYLRRALPVLRASAEFSLDWLVPHPQTGKLVAGPATSPENKFITADGQRASLCMGPAMEQQLVWDALNNYLQAAETLGLDEPTVAEARAALAKLQLPQIGRDGRLMEWNEEFKEAEPGHRHVSHLFALHPGRQITRIGTPELAAAARKSLDARLAAGGALGGYSGGEGPSTKAWLLDHERRSRGNTRGAAALPRQPDLPLDPP
ncbi:MAG: glycosyl hydrolase family 95 catalytic domain-containing protein, partial [Limisphaerales bacterium]